MFLFYSPVLQNDFLNLDDPLYIRGNPAIRSFGLDSLHWMFTTTYQGNWHPLTWLSLALDYQLGKLDPRIYHLDNLFLHALNTLLVFFLSLRLTSLVGKNLGFSPPPIPTAFLASLLFGLHPLHVEVVAWAVERTDLLCALFYLLGLLSYLSYANEVERKNWKWGLCLACFCLALMSKPTAVTFPLVLLLLDAWPLRRFQSEGALLEKAPFFILSLVITGITFGARSQAGAIRDLSMVPMDFRVLNAFHSIVFYAVKMAVPVRLAALYPLPSRLGAYSPENLASLLGVVALTAFLFLYRKRWPSLAASWTGYLLALLPVLGIVQVGIQAAADRYAYLPSLCLILPLSAGVSAFLSRQKPVLILLCFPWALGLGLGTMKQVGYWKDSVALWRHTVEIYPHYGQAREELWAAYDEKMALEEALRDIQEYLQVEPQSAMAYDSLAIHYGRQGRFKESEQASQKALLFEPSNPRFLVNLATTYQRQGKLEEAITLYRKGLAANPREPVYLLNLGNTYLLKGILPEAIETLQAAIRLQPQNPALYQKLGAAYEKSGRKDLAAKMAGEAQALLAGNP